MAKLYVPLNWPPGSVALGALLGMAGGLAVAYVPAVRGTPPFSWLFAIGMAAFRSEAAIKAIMALAIVCHVVEAAVTMYICRSNRVASRDAWGWFGLTLLIGAPAILELRKGIKEVKQSKQG
ncbi:hypothetical protein FOA52_005362 [Chlamydomonas sp. UWO 241]|nr:hypothetical protein FOA52_005362 [Chlamydomonas sp. UWO 241]